MVLNKNKLLYLNSKEKYKEIYEIFREEYKSMLKEFFRDNNIECIEKGSIVYYLKILSKNFNHEYDDISKIISESFLNKMDESMLPLSICIDSYNYVKKRLNV